MTAVTGENAICSICYEDLKPVVENLQSISACGHVFHELCLQQWFEYCPSTNKRNCPICKQKCSLKDPCRLYFQSSSNQTDSTQRDVEIENEDPILLRGEVKRLEGKIHNLNSALEKQKSENVEISDKLNQCKEELKEDKAKRCEALQEVSTAQHLLKLKSEECVELTSQCTKLQERTMALAKELASLKLVSDISLEEDDVLKLALLGNNAKTKDTIDTLVKSLVIRNRSYKELLAKCNQLGRGEARSLEKLEKSFEKIDKLKKRVRELEIISEERANKALRDIKVSKNCNNREASEQATASSVSFRMPSLNNTTEKISTPICNLEKNDGLRGRREDSKSVIEVDDDVPETTNPMMKERKFIIREEDPKSSSVQGSTNGSYQNLGRWSKHGERHETLKMSSVSSKDELITIGPDGKGGRIKVLRSKPQISNMNASLGNGKRFKLGTKTNGSSSSSQGCLQIEHFFGKSNIR